jgi:hypothetical protein
MKNEDLQVFCVREYKKSCGGIVQVTFYVPYREDENTYCPFRIVGLSEEADKLYKPFGFDSIDAFLFATMSLRNVLEPQRENISHDALEKLDVGIPRSLPTCFGVEFHDVLCELVEIAYEKASGLPMAQELFGEEFAEKARGNLRVLLQKFQDIDL